VLFAFVAELFADAFNATRMLADKVVALSKQQPVIKRVDNITADSDLTATTARYNAVLFS